MKTDVKQPRGKGRGSPATKKPRELTKHDYERLREADLKRHRRAAKKAENQRRADEGSQHTMKIRCSPTASPASTEAMGEFYDLALHPGGESPASPCYAPLRWSAEKPKRRGWWWLKVPHTQQARIVLVLANEFTCILETAEAGERLRIPLSDYVPEVRWAGPLPVPLEPPIVKPEHNVRISDRRKEALDV